MAEDSIFSDGPQEFFQTYFVNEGSCDAQSILPVGDHYDCHCTCGSWDVTVTDPDVGLELARRHTRSTP